MYGCHGDVLHFRAPRFMQQKPASDAFFVVEATLSIRPQVADLRAYEGVSFAPRVLKKKHGRIYFKDNRESAGGWGKAHFKGRSVRFLLLLPVKREFFLPQLVKEALALGV